MTGVEGSGVGSVLVLPCSFAMGSLSHPHVLSPLYRHPPRRVGKVELVVDKYRVDGARVLVAEVEVGDATGAVSLRARDAQIDLLRRVSRDGDAIVLRNCTIEVYREMYLRLAGKSNAFYSLRVENACPSC